MTASSAPTRPEHPATAGSADHHRQQLRQKSATVFGVAIGLAATIAFYVIAPWAAAPFTGGPEFVQRYFCGHPLEYITSAMFFAGMGILLAKFRQIPVERKGLRAVPALVAPDHGNAHGTMDIGTRIDDWLSKAAGGGWHATSMAQRLHDVRAYVTSRPNDGLEDHLKYLADLAADRLTQSYSLVRTVTWAVPIMGFLGTVIGITMAIANVTPEQLDSSLPEVTAGLAVAFDTTAQALGMSMILVFSTFLTERSEQTILNDVELFGIDFLLPLQTSTESASPAAGTFPAMTEWTARMLAEQTEAWSRQLAMLQSGWAEALSLQTSTLATALNEETEAALGAHRNSLNGSRDLYAATLQQSTHHFVSQLQQTMSAFTDRVDRWQHAIQATSQAAAGQAEELHQLGRTLLRLTESEERLAQLQDQLDRNLQTLQVVETLEQTVNSLNAAVHVLTAKTTLRAAA